MNRMMKMAAAIGVLLLAAGVTAMAAGSTEQAAPGRLVPIHQEIKDFFEARGADPTYLDKDMSQVPTAEWAKIVAILATPDDPDVTTDDHDVLNSLVLMSLMQATDTTDDPVYLDIGNSRWIYNRPSS